MRTYKPSRDSLDYREILGMIQGSRDPIENHARDFQASDQSRRQVQERIYSYDTFPEVLNELAEDSASEAD